MQYANEGSGARSGNVDYISEMHAHHAKRREPGLGHFDLLSTYELPRGAEPKGSCEMGLKWTTPGHHRAAEVYTPLQALENGSEASIRSAFSKLSKESLIKLISSVKDCEGETKTELANEAVELFKHSLSVACSGVLDDNDKSFVTLRRLTSTLDPALSKKKPSELCHFFRHNLGVAGHIGVVVKHLKQGAEDIVTNMFKGVTDANAKRKMQKILAPLLTDIAEAVHKVGGAFSQALQEASSKAIETCKQDGTRCFAALMALQQQFCRKADVSLSPFILSLNKIIGRFIENADSSFAPADVGGLGLRIVSKLAAQERIMVPVNLQAGMDAGTRQVVLKRMKDNRPLIEKAIQDHYKLLAGLGHAKDKIDKEQKEKEDLLARAPEEFLKSLK